MQRMFMDLVQEEWTNAFLCVAFIRCIYFVHNSCLLSKHMRYVVIPSDIKCTYVGNLDTILKIHDL
jgi:hypothetical protein